MSSNRSSALLAAAEGILAELREIRAALLIITSSLEENRKKSSTPRRSNPHAQLLSQREAARRLGVDRNTTLVALIRTGQLRTVEVNGKRKVPASEVERLAQEGFDSTMPEPRRRAPRPRPAGSRSPGDVIRALKL